MEKWSPVTVLEWLLFISDGQYSQYEDAILDHQINGFSLVTMIESQHDWYSTIIPNPSHRWFISKNYYTQTVTLPQSIR